MATEEQRGLDKKKGETSAAAHVFVRKEISGPEETSGSQAPERRKRRPGAKEATGNREALIREKLTEIYENDDGTMPDMTSFERRRKSRLISAFFTLIFSAIFLAGAAWAAFFVFPPAAAFSHRDVILSITGDQAVTLGATVHYRLRYRNAQFVPLSKVTLVVRYPRGFVFRSSSREPTNDKKDEWALGTLDEDGSGFIDIDGQFFGDVGEQQSWRVFLNYTPANASAEFQKVATITVGVTQSPVALAIGAPESIRSGEEVVLVLAVQPRLATSSDQFILELNPGDSFVKKNSEPAAEPYAPYRWIIPDLRQERKVILRGAFKSPDGSRDPEIRAVVRGNGGRREPGDGGYIFASSTVVVHLSAALSLASLQVNG
ncbi:MAG: hypothetical protein HY984_02605, partial [Candidatus Magasanikbacteria bacterium]|nr:hypothetical protein [Candidatus Magasanikbacteria bacterium]